MEEEVKGDDAEAQEAEPVFDILLSYQAVLPARIMTDQLRMQLVTSVGETDLEVEFETV